MSFIELTRVDNTAILLNKYHITSVSRSVDHPNKRLIIRMNNGQTQEVLDDYKTVVLLLEGKYDACK
jgi:hypothetical protein